MQFEEKWRGLRTRGNKKWNELRNELWVLRNSEGWLEFVEEELKNEGLRWKVYEIDIE